MSTETKRLQDAINFITSAGREAIEEIELLHQQLHGTRQREEKPDGFSPWKPLPKGEKDEHYIDGHPIEYWHQITTSTLKTNNELIDRLREKERINADLEQRLQTMGNSYLGELRRANHQAECAKTAQDERDTALRELDAMREKMNNQHRSFHVCIQGEPSAQITPEAFKVLQDSAQRTGVAWVTRVEGDTTTLKIG